MPWIDPGKPSGVQPGALPWIYLLLCLPTLFVTGRSLLRARDGDPLHDVDVRRVIAFRVLYLVASAYCAPEFERPWPWPTRSASVLTSRRPSTGPRPNANSRLPEFAGHNPVEPGALARIAFVMLGLAWTLFARAAKGGRLGAGPVAKPTAAGSGTATPRPSHRRRPSVRPQPAMRAGRSSGRSPGSTSPRPCAARLIVLLGVGFVKRHSAACGSPTRSTGTPFTRHPRDDRDAAGAFTIIPLVIAIYYAGELVWRDRERRVHEIVDATPAPTGRSFVPKIVALSLVLFATLAASTLAAIAVQALKGYFHFESASTSRGTCCRRRSARCCSRCWRSSCRRCAQKSFAGC